MTNYEWLLNMGGEERQAWFDAQHVEGVEIQGEPDEIADSREKLEADASELTADYAASGDVCDALYGGIVGLLDRQAAITERELCKQCDWPSLAAQPDYESQGRIVALTNKVDELTAERDALADDLLTCNKEREEYRELFSEALTLAAEIVNLQP